MIDIISQLESFFHQMRSNEIGEISLSRDPVEPPGYLRATADLKLGMAHNPTRTPITLQMTFHQKRILVSQYLPNQFLELLDIGGEGGARVIDGAEC